VPPHGVDTRHKAGHDGDDDAARPAAFKVPFILRGIA
jgi:hypothetical protein